eukprot:COSAG02_NODE_4567_length_5211_cov_1170.642606_2_plen_77_part_00
MLVWRAEKKAKAESGTTARSRSTRLDSLDAVRPRARLISDPGSQGDRLSSPPQLFVTLSQYIHLHTNNGQRSFGGR